MQVTLSAIDSIRPEAIRDLRLTQRVAQPYLLLARDAELSEALLPTPGSSRRLSFADVGVLERPSAWDAKPSLDRPGAYVTLHVQMESAIAWAMLKTPDSAKSRRLHMETFAVYDHPRFAKGQQPDEWTITAVSYTKGLSIPVVFPRLRPFDPPAVEVGRYSETILDARLLSVSHEYWLFLLQPDSTAISKAPVRQTPYGIQEPASLRVIHLDAAFQPTAPAAAVFGSTPIYEFDVDAAADGSAVVFATTSEGVLFARGVLAPGKPLPSNAWAITEMPAPLVSPSVLVNGGLAHVAAISNLGLPQAAVVYGVVQL